MTATHPVLNGSPYRGYVYAYPHKTAYRPLLPRPLRDVWDDEPRGSLFLYAHVPFCGMRCGFCNLFTTANPAAGLVPLYLDALRRQADAVREVIPDARFVRFAVGGGTPTYLSEPELETLFAIFEPFTGPSLAAVPTGVEASPDTLTRGKVELLVARGVDRVSLGVQSFFENETGRAGRPQSRKEVEAAINLLVGRFPTVNVDLIYGLPGQTVASWLASVRTAVAFGPEELYLYPLYVRPLTGLGKSAKTWDDWRLDCYREARALLLSAGYSQVSMRMFRKGSPEQAGPAYCCQEDGMVGLGSGARSYTRGLHYSFEYAVAAGGVKGIIADYLSRDADRLAAADYGFALNADEQRRRYLLQSLLTVDGLDAARYASRFQTDPADDFPDLRAFADLGLVVKEDGRWRPTALGLERSDALGPWFFSARVRALTAEYEPR
jgi:oxygen-independent coproporphyrinogen-3 oxidase